MSENIVFSGRNIVACYRIVNLREAFHENFSIVGDDINLAGMTPLSVVQSVSFSLPGGVEILSAPPMPYPVVLLPQEVPAIDVNINLLWTPNDGALFHLYASNPYPTSGLDLLVENKVSLGGFFFPACIPRSLELRYDEMGRPMVVTLGLLAPAVFVIPQGSAPPYNPNTSNITFVRNITTTVVAEGAPPPLTVTQMSLSLNENITAQHTTLAVAPATPLQQEILRFPRFFTKGITIVGLQMRTFAAPSTPPSIPTGKEISLSLQGRDLHVSNLLVEIEVTGFVRNVSTEMSPEGLIFFSVDMFGRGTLTKPPISFTVP